MTYLAYAVGHLHPVAPVDEDVFRYMELIQATMDPYGGAFLVHGKQVEVKEGEWPGFFVLIGFPDIERARAWYASEAYQEILPLRTRAFTADILLVEGVAPGYDAAATAAGMRAAARQEA